VRILHVYPGNLYGGVESDLVTLARYRHECSALEQHFAVCFEGRLAEELRACGAMVHQLGAVRMRLAHTVMRARRVLRRLMADVHFDAVTCHSSWSHAVFAPVVRESGSALAFWLHDAVTKPSLIDRCAMRIPADFAICNSSFTRSTVDRLFAHIPAEVLYNPIDDEAIRSEKKCREATRREMGVDERTIVIAQVGRLERWKGHAIHLQALAGLNTDREWTCWFIGGPQRPHEMDYFNELRLAAKRFGLERRVHFLGQRNDVPRLLSAVDIFCQPNTGAEPFGNVFVEAMFAGIPVVTSNIGGAPEVVDDSCGILTSADDVAAVTKALKTLIEDSHFRNKLGANGPSRASKLCDPVQQLQRSAQMFSKVCKNERPGELSAVP
jgi:glycosyltransferase involved in cell wall biosynthesis